MRSNVAITDPVNLRRAVFPMPRHDFVLSVLFLHTLSAQGSGNAHYFSMSADGYNLRVRDARLLL